MEHEKNKMDTSSLAGVLIGIVAATLSVGGGLYIAAEGRPGLSIIGFVCAAISVVGVIVNASELKNSLRKNPHTR